MSQPEPQLESQPILTDVRPAHVYMGTKTAGYRFDAGKKYEQRQMVAVLYPNADHQARDLREQSQVEPVASSTASTSPVHKKKKKKKNKNKKSKPKPTSTEHKDAARVQSTGLLRVDGMVFDWKTYRMVRALIPTPRKSRLTADTRHQVYVLMDSIFVVTLLTWRVVKILSERVIPRMAAYSHMDRVRRGLAAFTDMFGAAARECRGPPVEHFFLHGNALLIGMREHGVLLTGIAPTDYTRAHARSLSHTFESLQLMLDSLDSMHVTLGSYGRDVLGRNRQCATRRCLERHIVCNHEGRCLFEMARDFTNTNSNGDQAS